MNVLQISTTPIKLSMTSQRARLESEIPDPEVGIINHPGKLQMKSENIKVNIDTFQSRQSMGYSTAKGLMQAAAQKGMEAAQNATAQYVQIGNQMAQIQKGADIADIMKQYVVPAPVMTGIKFIPSQGADISWEPAQLSREYTPAEVEFQPQADFKNSTYIPGELQINVEQFPKVEIEYIGGPLYVPPSADPSYDGDGIPG